MEPKKIPTIKVRIDKTRHKSQPFKVTKCGRVEQELDERYLNEWSACRGAVRSCRDFLKKGASGVFDRRVLILLPGDRQRYGYLWTTGYVRLGSVTARK